MPSKKVAKGKAPSLSEFLSSPRKGRIQCSVCLSTKEVQTACKEFVAAKRAGTCDQTIQALSDFLDEAYDFQLHPISLSRHLKKCLGGLDGQ